MTIKLIPVCVCVCGGIRIQPVVVVVVVIDGRILCTFSTSSLSCVTHVKPFMHASDALVHSHVHYYPLYIRHKYTLHAYKHISTTASVFAYADTYEVSEKARE